VFIRIIATQHDLWREVDQHGNVLDIVVQSRRNAVAAKRFFGTLLKNLEYVPRVIVTDKLGSYQVAHRELLASVEDRELASTHQAAGTGDETVHIARARTAVLVRVAWHFTAFSAGPAPTDRTRMAYRDG
jgi:transposase-like protein